MIKNNQIEAESFIGESSSIAAFRLNNKKLCIKGEEKMNEFKEKEVKMNEKVYSRRDMLKTAGKAAAGVAAVAVLPSFITGCDKKTPETSYKRSC